MSNNIMGPSFPPIDGGGGGLIGKIVKAIKTLVDIFKKPAEEAGKTDQTNSLENIERITQIFADFKEQVHARAIEIEKAVEGEVGYYVEELHNILDENKEKVTRYGIRTKRIERQIDKISSRVKGTIDNELSKRVSLDNAQCKEIVKMIPGAKKESAMSEFFSKSIKGALDVCCTEMHSSIDEIYDDVEAEVVGAVDSIQRQAEQLQNTFSSIDETNYEETARRQMVEAYYLSDVCDMVLEIL